MPYQLVGEDDNAYHVADDSGEPFKVAKKGLSQSTHDKILGMKPKDLPSDVVEPVATSPIPASSPSMAPADSFVSSIQQPSALAVQPVVAPVPVVPAVQPQVPVEVTPAPVAAQQQTPSAQMPDLSQGLTGSLKNIYDMQSSGLKQEASALAKKADLQAKIQEQNIIQQQQQMELAQKKRAELDLELNQIYEGMKNQKIDPDRFMNNMSEGSRTWASVGVALGALASAMLGKNRNDALDLLQKQIDRDVEAQKADLGKQNNLLSFNMQRYGNLEAAEAATRLQKASIVQAQLEMAAAKLGRPEIMGKLQQQLADKALKDYEPLKEKLAQQQAMQQLASGGGSVDAMTLEKAGEEARKRGVALPGGNRFALAPTEDDAKEVKKQLDDLDTVEKSVQDALEFNKSLQKDVVKSTKGFDLPVVGPVGTDAYKKGMALRAKIMTAMGKLYGVDKAGGPMAKNIERMVPDPGENDFFSNMLGFGESSSTELLKSLQKQVDDKRALLYKTRLQGVKPTPKSLEGAPVPSRKK